MEALSQSRSGSRSRRASRPQTPTHISLAPLTPKIPLADYDSLYAAHGDPETGGDYIIAGHSYHQQRRHNRNLTMSTSYLSSTSVPATPRILSRSSSRTRLNTTGPTSYTTSGMAKSKSSAHLRQANSRSSMIAPLSPITTRDMTRPRSSANLAQGSRSRQDDGEWLLRAGLALTTETREAKGQSWLAQRDSSTSLISQDDEEDDIFPPRGRGARLRPHKSNGSSPVLSRRGSRTRGGRGSDLFLTPSQSNTNMTFRSNTADSAMTQIAGMTPDFVDAQPDLLSPTDFEDLDDLEEEIDENDDERENSEDLQEMEREMQHLTQDRGFGLGGLVDRVMGWALFENADDESFVPTTLSRTRGEMEAGLNPDESAIQTTESADANAAEVPDLKEDVIREAGQPKPGEEGEVRWEDDAAWLIGLAKKIIV